MNLVQLRAFDAVARTGSITEAARRLYVTQPAVHIKTLEHTYDVALLRRQGPRGRAHRPRDTRSPPSPESCSRSKTARWSCSAPTNASSGARCASPPMDPTSRCRWSRSSGAGFRGYGSRWRSRARRGCRRASPRKRCDVSIQGSLAENDALHAVELSEFDVIAFVNRDHPWARDGRELVPFPEIDRHPVIAREAGSTMRQRFDAACAEAGIEPEYFIETTSRETVKEAVRRGSESGSSPRRSCVPTRGCGPVRLTGTDLRYTERVVCLQRRRSLAVIREFLRIAEEARERPLPE